MLLACSLTARRADAALRYIGSWSHVWPQSLSCASIRRTTFAIGSPATQEARMPATSARYFSYMDRSSAWWVLARQSSRERTYADMACLSGILGTYYRRCTQWRSAKNATARLKRVIATRRFTRSLMLALRDTRSRASALDLAVSPRACHTCAQKRALQQGCSDKGQCRPVRTQRKNGSHDERDIRPFSTVQCRFAPAP